MTYEFGTLPEAVEIAVGNYYGFAQLHRAPVPNVDDPETFIDILASVQQRTNVTDAELIDMSDAIREMALGAGRFCLELRRHPYPSRAS